MPTFLSLLFCQVNVILGRERQQVSQSGTEDLLEEARMLYGLNGRFFLSYF